MRVGCTISSSAKIWSAFRWRGNATARPTAWTAPMKASIVVSVDVVGNVRPPMYSVWVVPENRQCFSWDFRCNNTGKCIPKAWVCDGEADCTDSADEMVAEGCPSKLVCFPNQFQCLNGQCIAKVALDAKARENSPYITPNHF